MPASSNGDAGAARGGRALATAAAATAAALALCASSPILPAARAAAAAAPETPTARVALDFGIAERAVKAAADRTLGSLSILPLEDAAANPVGRVVVALYGDRAPASARNFCAAARGGFLDGTAVSRIVPGEYVQLGRQGARRQGDVEFPQGALAPNPDVSSAAALRVGAGDRPGTVALSLGENDEDPGVRAKPGYVPFEFFITTGPGPAPRLNDANVAFGRVESGYDVLAAIAKTKTFEPDARGRQLNRFAAFIGDDRADKVARRYGRPLRAVVVLKAEVLEEAGAAAAAGGR
jgi:peptidyl-prolyl cis-trans isomerase B (cyclophilin B)